MIIFSILNFKDMLDIIDVVNISKGKNFDRIRSFFSTIDCTKTSELYSLQEQYQQNINLRKQILDFFNLEGIHKFPGDNNSRVSTNVDLLFEEYKRSFSLSIKNKRKCSNRLSFTEIVSFILSLGYFFLKMICYFIWLILLIVNYYKKPLNKIKNKKMTKIKGIFNNPLIKRILRQDS